MTNVESLYYLCGSFVVKHFNGFKDKIAGLPTLMVYDVYEQALQSDCISELCGELKDINHFAKLLERKEKWNVLFQLVYFISQKHPDFLNYLSIHQAYNNMTDSVGEIVNDTDTTYSNFEKALRMSTFLVDAGHFFNAGITMSFGKDLSLSLSGDLLYLQFELWNRLLHVYTLDCKFKEAKTAYLNAGEVFGLLPIEEINRVNVTLHYTATSLYLFSLSDYDRAYKFSIEAIKVINQQCSVRDVIDALRQAAKTCIVKRKFKPAELLVKKAVQLSRNFFGCKSPKFAESLSDFAFYLLNIDCVAASVEVYEDALEIRQNTLGEINVLAAIAHEDLAYALYVRDYSIGVFGQSRYHAEIAIATLTKLLPPDHLLLASSKRVKALILEELAIDFREKETSDELLLTAEQLHLESLQLARISFGEKNVQTAKHYGNLGRLYQSMKRYDEAEKMHLKAINIKEHLLGSEDYEVALSLGHLASLYNYDMKRYTDAEQLYQRSIRIGLSLFGESYSGLEYDYRGLIYLYAKTSNFIEMEQYRMVLSNWEQSRRGIEIVKPMEDVGTWENISMEELIDRIDLCTLDGESH